MKAILVFSTLIFSVHSFAVVTKPKVVIGTGSSIVGTGDVLIVAQRKAVSDAEGLCGGGPIEFAENIGWKIEYANSSYSHCYPGRYCEGGDTYAIAEGIFICLNNIK